jgi:hypothetical protein
LHGSVPSPNTRYPLIEPNDRRSATPDRRDRSEDVDLPGRRSDRVLAA